MKRKDTTESTENKKPKFEKLLNDPEINLIDERIYNICNTYYKQNEWKRKNVPPLILTSPPEFNKDAQQAEEWGKKMLNFVVDKFQWSGTTRNQNFYVIDKEGNWMTKFNIKIPGDQVSIQIDSPPQIGSVIVINPSSRTLSYKVTELYTKKQELNQMSGLDLNIVPPSPESKELEVEFMEATSNISVEKPSELSDDELSSDSEKQQFLLLQKRNEHLEKGLEQFKEERINSLREQLASEKTITQQLRATLEVEEKKQAKAEETLSDLNGQIMNIKRERKSLLKSATEGQEQQSGTVRNFR